MEKKIKEKQIQKNAKLNIAIGKEEIQDNGRYIVRNQQQQLRSRNGEVENKKKDKTRQVNSQECLVG